MRNLVAVVLGLVVGISGAIGLGAALVALAPTPEVRVTAAASVAAPSPSPAPSSEPAASAEPAPTAAGSGSNAEPTPASAESTSPFPLVGRPAPALTAPQVGGGAINLAALRGKPVWLVFTGTFCPSCRDEYPVMNRFAARYGDTGLVVVAIHVREGEQTVAPFVSSLNVAFPVGLDEDGSRARGWDAAVLPVHYFIDAQGVVRDAAVGGIGPDVIVRGLQAILPGVTVKP